MELRHRGLLILVVTLVSFVALGSLPTRGYAWEGWCEDDPAVIVNGQQIILDVAVPQQNLFSVNGVAQFVVTVPSNVSAGLLSNDPAWFADNIAFATDGRSWNGRGAIPVDVSVTVPGSESFPVRFVIQAPAGPLTKVVTGNSNEPITRHVELPASLLSTHGAGKGS